jgi:hypothetical protein
VGRARFTTKPSPRSDARASMTKVSTTGASLLLTPLFYRNLGAETRHRIAAICT